MRILRDLAVDIAVKETISPSPSPSSSSSSSSMGNNAMISTAKNCHVWKSPIPYLFGALAMMLLLITIALLLLVVSYRRGGSNRASQEENKPAKTIEAVDLEPNIVVIMAGDDKPTYLATPSLTIAMPTANICSCGDQTKPCDDQD